MLRITVKGVPLSVDDGEITKMLEKCNATSGIKYEKIRDPETRKMTGILNGNRFIYHVKQFEEGKILTEDQPLRRTTVFHLSLWATQSKPHTNVYKLLGNHALEK